MVSTMAARFRVRWVVAVVVAFGWLAGSSSVPAADPSALASLAQSMAPGTWAELKTSGLTPAFLQVPTHVQVYHILEYKKCGVADPTSRQVLVVGGPHESPGRFITCDEATNAWRQEPDPTPSYIL